MGDRMPDPRRAGKRYREFVHLFGLTGGIASGKSAIALVFRDAGLPVLDADAFAREVVTPGSPALAEIAAHFGASILAASGDLDRKALADIVFANPGERIVLNRIVHPRIAERTQAEASRLAAAGEPLACYEAALLVENGMADAFRPLVVVVASLDVQVARLALRDSLPPEDVRARIAAQAPVEEKRRAADIVIENDGTREALEQHARAALARVCKHVSVDAARYGVTT